MNKNIFFIFLLMFVGSSLVNASTVCDLDITLVSWHDLKTEEGIIIWAKNISKNIL